MARVEDMNADELGNHRHNLAKVSATIETLKYVYHNAEHLPIEQVKEALRLSLALLESGIVSAQMRAELASLLINPESEK